MIRLHMRRRIVISSSDSPKIWTANMAKPLILNDHLTNPLRSPWRPCRYKSVGADELQFWRRMALRSREDASIVNLTESILMIIKRPINSIHRVVSVHMSSQEKTDVILTSNGPRILQTRCGLIERWGGSCWCGRVQSTPRPYSVCSPYLGISNGLCPAARRCTRFTPSSCILHAIRAQTVRRSLPAVQSCTWLSAPQP